MRLYKDVEERKKILLEFIQKHPNTTHREVREVLHMKVIKIYSNGLEEAFKDAGMKSPRTFKRMTKEEKKKIVIDYARRHPKARGQTIKKDTKIDFFTIFKDTEELFKVAGIPYAPKYNSSLVGNAAQRKNIIFETIRKNPHMGLTEMSKLLHMSLYRHFHDIRQLYEEAGVKYSGKGIKRRVEKQNQAIAFIKKNNYATQREINRACKTSVQKIFEHGIFDAYNAAGVDFPFERLNIHGVAIKSIKDDAVRFEEEISKKLSGFGTVSRLVKTKRGFADIILERNGKKVAIEVKNYKSHEISISQIKQLNKYLEDIDSNIGFLICNKKPKKDTFLIGKNKIIVLQNEELGKIPEILDMDL